MKKNYKSLLPRIFGAFLVLLNLCLFAQNLPRPGGGGTTGPDRPANTPIDMYVYVLAIVAIAFIYYYAKKTNKKLI